MKIGSVFSAGSRATIRYRLALLLGALAALVGTGYFLTGSFQFLFSDFWFASGFLLLLLLSLVDQPYFSTDGNFFLNGITGLAALVGVPLARRDGVWYVFFAWTMYLIASSYTLMLMRTRAEARSSGLLRYVSGLNQNIGRPEALYSAFLIWGLITQFGSDSREFRVLLTYWVVLMVVNLPGIANKIEAAWAGRLTRRSGAIGAVTKVISPRVVEVDLIAGCRSDIVGRAVEIYRGVGECSATGRVIDDRMLAGFRHGVVAITKTTERFSAFASDVASEPLLVRLSETDDSLDPAPIGVVDKDTEIATLRLEINPSTALAEGEVLSVTLPDGRIAYFQVVAGKVKEASIHDAHAIQSVGVSAGQLGIWSDNACRFEPIPWVAPAGELVSRVVHGSGAMWPIPEGHVRVGRVPNSAFPIHVTLDDIVTHNTALIGVTGSGKTFLALSLVEAMAQKGIKVLVLDLTRQYWDCLLSRNPVAIKKPDEVDAWLESDRPVAIHQFADANNYTDRSAVLVERAFKKLEASVKLKAGKNEPARLCIVFEEAHSLIPEWNQVAQKDDSINVGRTARYILQGRKFGLGSLIVTQRTANVTKTILNQCNTIFALQSFDQTGLDFLRNYMGESYAQAISTLPPRHAVLVGKASSSARPVLFEVQTLGAQWNQVTAGAVDDGASQAPGGS